MKYQDIFKRYELKYLLDKSQEEAVLDAINNKMELDEYGVTSIRNIYYDTPTYYLIRTSLDKPVYKEKLRLRSYGSINEDNIAFVEIKKKYEGIVYKRRIALKENEASTWLNTKTSKPLDSQIADEIDYFIHYYEGLKPSCFLSYDRRAYKDKTGNSLRLTLDKNIMARTSDLTLLSDCYGEKIIPDDMTLMEFKTPSSIPLWLIRCFEENNIKQTSFSKYGRAYQNLIYNKINFGG